MDLKSWINRILWKYDNMIIWNFVMKVNEENFVWISRWFDVDMVWWCLIRNSVVWWLFCNICFLLFVWVIVVFYLLYFGLFKLEIKYVWFFVIYDLFYMYWCCDFWVMFLLFYVVWLGIIIFVVLNFSINIINL